MKLSKTGFVALLGIVASTTLPQTSMRAATIRDDELPGGYLDLATSLEYAPVGMFSGSVYNGSATLIAPDWVLTAAHVLTASSSGTFTINGISYGTIEVFRHPGWNGNPFNGYDFGLAHLSTPVAGVTPATLYTGTSEVGQTNTYVGFGFTGTGLTGWQPPVDNQKRAFQNVSDGDFGNPSILLGSDFDNPHTTADNAFGDATPMSLEGCVAPGDSGGGVFLPIGSQSYLAGVISFVAGTDGNGNADYGDVSGFGRVSAFVPWINSIMVPEPSSSMLLTGAGLVMLLRWRCRQVGK